jgi:hypothetical protein
MSRMSNFKYLSKSNLIFRSDMAQDIFQRLDQGVEALISRERSPGVFDTPPQDFDQV